LPSREGRPNLSFFDFQNDEEDVSLTRGLNARSFWALTCRTPDIRGALTGQKSGAWEIIYFKPHTTGHAGEDIGPVSFEICTNQKINADRHDLLGSAL
jgi:hypothetical protein